MGDTTKRRTMVKDRVGCVRTSTYALPEGNHTYGLQKKPDPENAGEIISNWITANPSEMKKSKSMTVYQNILSIKHGCVTAKAMRQFGIDHPNIRLKEQLGNESGRPGPSHDGAFGIKTQFTDESIKELIQADFTSYFNEDGDYPDVSTIESQSQFPRPRPTKSSLILAEKQKKQTVEKPHFIMKKFRGAQCTFSTQPTKSGRGGKGAGAGGGSDGEEST